MKIAVTGGAGFIGSHIVDAYINAGHDVVIIDDMSGGKLSNIHPNATFVHMSITSPEIDAVFAREKFDVVNHHAAQVSVRISVEDPLFDADINVKGLLNILEASRRHGVKKIIFASSAGTVYGEQRYFPADEKHGKNPVSQYGVTKLVGEKYLFCYQALYGIQYVVLRYTNVYGPRQNPHGEAGVVAIFIEKMLKGEQPIINGDGTQTRDYIFVSDVVQANMIAIKEGVVGTFNCATGAEYTVNTIFQLLQLKTRARLQKKYGPAKEGEQKRSVASYEKIRHVLGWKPEVSFQEGLNRTADWFAEALHTEKETPPQKKSTTKKSKPIAS
jgi:UDP-glucose 4-epimerase